MTDRSDVGPVDVRSVGENLPLTPPNSRSQLTAGWATLLSTVNVATLLSLIAGACYFYDRAYRLAYYKPFGLDPSAIPIAVQDAIVDGFLGITMHVTWVLVIVTLFAVAYVAISWFGARFIDRAVAKVALLPRQRPPHPTILELGQNGGFQISVVASAVTLTATVLSIAALFVIGIPGDRAGRDDANQVRASIRQAARACARYTLKGGAVIVGQGLGSTTERQFVLSADNAVRVLRFDDLEALAQEPVRCVQPDLQRSSAQGTSTVQEQGTRRR